ncbi:PREDICTED: uncharacterized protein LOC105560676 [Vollenhovia emeryi]|uniref:uncharacterized protein LOC105560676 n=1 Tax=Vollenhovia emeryi TaxID=411798 RepID=UPI0005F54493|nr:PREDICTED: uncharacterized protein LOC105560676 [Vollenhovia emeryi]XP_011865376.1 PREDICTED: uncharacterized protein LOC105560676 [Vollenhovia emeryi]
MSEQVIDEYYTNLEYDRDSKEKALTDIATLSRGVQFKNSDDFSTRFHNAASVIKENLSLFKSACEHVDTVTIILEYLTNFGAKLTFSNRLDEYNREDGIVSVMFTIFSICREQKVQLFLENAIIKSSTLYKSRCYRLKKELSNETNEMILLSDSDLYAVVSYLNIVGHSRINKIWVQMPIKQKFLSLVKKYFRPRDLRISTWISIGEFIPRESCDMSITSIWSESIVDAKQIASLLDRDVVFINMHMDLYGGIVLLPWIKILDKLHERLPTDLSSDGVILGTNRTNEIHFLNLRSSMTSVPLYNLFYDGKWHKSTKGMYWKHNDDSYRAYATSEDLLPCVNSAVEGFKTWKTLHIDTRQRLLQELVTALKYNSKFLKDADKLIRYSQFNETLLLCSQTDRLEVIQNRLPRGIIVLKEKTEDMLFLRLIQILICGNSVIVLTDMNSSNLAQYCDIFSLCKIPRGVVNVLSHANTSDLELSLCATDYVNYEEQFFTSSWDETYTNLTLPKHTVFSFK